MCAVNCDSCDSSRKNTLQWVRVSVLEWFCQSITHATLANFKSSRVSERFGAVLRSIMNATEPSCDVSRYFAGGLGSMHDTSQNQSSSGSTTGSYRRLRPLSTRRFGQPRRLGSRRASSPSGARAGGLSVKPCACSPAPLPPLLLPSFRRALPLTSWVCGVVSSCMAERVARTRQLACGNVGLVLGKVGYTFSSVARVCRKSAG